MNTKPWFQSKANWTAVATFIGGIVPVFMATNSGLLGDHVALLLTGLTAGLSAVIQFAIRTFWTDTAIGK